MTARASARLGEPPKALMLALRDAFAVDYFVETGTYRGATATWAANHFAQVVTIEASDELHRAAVAAHGHLENLRLVLGDTRSVLPEELARLDAPAIVWLDSHWSGGATFGEESECPLLAEIDAVRSARHEHYLFIDDARLFAAPPPRPHKMEHWPGLTEVTEALTRGERPLEVLIFDDSFVAVPPQAKALVWEYAREAAAPPDEEPKPRPRPLAGAAQRLRVRARRLSGFVPSAGRRSEVRTVAPTSLSDNVRYPDFCRRAAHNSRVFAQFRRDPGYMSVLGLDEKWGWKYFEALTPDSPAARLIPEAAAKDDLIGDPITLTLPDGIAVAPTTLRYLKVADDLERLFGSLDGGSVCEIGAGYGGQCRVLDALWPLRSYTLVDLRPVLSLAERYLAHFALNCEARFRTMNELPVESYDLFISNYAFSELAGHIQEAYFRKAIAATPRGYVLFNDLGSRNRGGMTAERLCELTGGRLLPEEPLTHPRNCLIVWGA